MWVVGDLARRRFLCGALLQMADNSGAGTIYILGGHSGFNIGVGTRIITCVHAHLHSSSERVEQFRYFGNQTADVL